MLQLVTVPCLADNYAFLLHDSVTGQTALVDAPDAEPILTALRQHGWGLDDILLTHHHWDHIDGTAALVAATGARVTGAAADAHRLPPLDRAVSPGDRITICGETVEVIDVPGHTVGHVAFHFPDSKMAFTGDSLMALGCGRLFEGTPAQMWDSLTRLAALPTDTLICSGHEYTTSNGRFALSLEDVPPALILRMEGVERARAASQPTVPSTLAEELATNPFLRARDPAMKAALGMTDAQDAAVFAEIRARKDKF
ncbi:hydroxyacylglutathione hydrolase [Gemmobacter caeni]|jgi:hydroxyacylglutathione hydrolase|uniref:Hydroxyacylglutathione hydrolase n=1 Tax=Gemmobacter caeni TaxID=589035 RepID=A0A2T6B6N3_9RHOB|nr:hydroxyacylglutathione hydrolase [Gemmobacter caeni]PTX51730.1 hydroxyacylglutathione hydrolase [Gemmobacter caeni]TWJ03858.1 hydroxyacylglutathione hydrolase [Gemmobacter caeni]